MIKLFTHNDWDGIACGILAKIAFGNNVDISYCGYETIDKEVKDIFSTVSDYDMVFITDIRIKDYVADEIDRNFDCFYLLDHHGTALYLNKYKWCKVLVENEETHILTSGTELYYNWLVENGYLEENDTLRRFTECVRDYDTWRWFSLGEEGLICKKLNDLLYLYGQDKFILWCLEQINKCIFPTLSETDILLLDLKQKEIDEYIDNKDKQLIISDFRGRPCGYVFADRYVSELGNTLCRRHPEIDFIAMIDMNGSVSYRTVKEDIHLGKDVASLFGGGGHPKAAGSEFDIVIQKKFIYELFK